MDNNENLKNELDEFLVNQPKKQTTSENEIVITPKTGLVEKIDRTLITPDGRTLLTERIH